MFNSRRYNRFDMEGLVNHNGAKYVATVFKNYVINTMHEVKFKKDMFKYIYLDMEKAELYLVKDKKAGYPLIIEVEYNDKMTVKSWREQFDDKENNNRLYERFLVVANSCLQDIKVKQEQDFLSQHIPTEFIVSMADIVKYKEQIRTVVQSCSRYWEVDKKVPLLVRLDSFHERVELIPIDSYKNYDDIYTDPIFGVIMPNENPDDFLKKILATYAYIHDTINTMREESTMYNDDGKDLVYQLLVNKNKRLFFEMEERDSDYDRTPDGLIYSFIVKYYLDEDLVPYYGGGEHISYTLQSSMIFDMNTVNLDKIIFSKLIFEREINNIMNAR